METESLDEKGMCLPRTIASVISSVAGHTVDLPQWVYERRKRQLELPETVDVDVREAKRLRWLLRRLQKDPSEAGKTLRNLEIKYGMGSLEDVDRALDEGKLVAVCVTNRARTKSHVMHVKRVGPRDFFGDSLRAQITWIKNESDDMLKDKKILARQMGYYKGPFNMVIFSKRSTK